MSAPTVGLFPRYDSITKKMTRKGFSDLDDEEILAPSNLESNLTREDQLRWFVSTIFAARISSRLTLTKILPLFLWRRLLQRLSAELPTCYQSVHPFRWRHHLSRCAIQWSTLTPLHH